MEKKANALSPKIAFVFMGHRFLYYRAVAAGASFPPSPECSRNAASRLWLQILVRDVLSGLGRKHQVLDSQKQGALRVTH